MTQHSAEPRAWDGDAAFSPLQLLDALEYAVTAIDLDGRFVVWNRAAEQLFGYPADQMLGYAVLDVVPAIWPGFADIQEQLRAGASWSGITKIQRRDTSSLAVPTTHAPIYNADGDLVGITSLWAFEPRSMVPSPSAQLDWAGGESAHPIVEATLHNLVESAPDGILTIGSAGRIALANRRAEQMFGYAHGELLGQSVEVLVPKHLRATHLAHRAGYLASPRHRPMHTGLDLYGKRKDGSEFPVEINLSPLERAGELLTTVIVRDVTLRRAIEARANQFAEERMAWIEAEAARQAAERSVAHLTCLQAVIAALSGALTPTAVAEAMLQRGLPEIGAEAGALFARTEDGAALELLGVVGAGAALPMAERIELASAIPAAQVAQTGEPLWFAPFKVAGQRFPIYAGPGSNYQAGAELPLAIEGRVVGVLTMRFAQPRLFDQEDRAFLLAVAGQCAQALERARLYTAEQRARRAAEQAQQHLAARNAVAAVLAGATLVDAPPLVLEAACKHLGWDWGALWCVDPPAGILRCMAIWYPPAIDAAEFHALSQRMTFVPGAGLPGRIWASAAPLWITDLEYDDNFPRRPAAMRAGLRSALGLPIHSIGRIVGVIEFFCREARPPDHEMLATATAIASQVGQFFERRRAEEERLRLLDHLQSAHAEAEAERQRYLDLVHGLDAIVWEADAATFQFRFISQRAEEMLGYPTERWLAEPNFWAEHLVPEDREWVVQYCRASTNALEDHQFEYRFYTADGQIVWVRDIVHVVADEQGRPALLRGVMLNLTERKCAEEERARLYEANRAALAEVEIASARLGFLSEASAALVASLDEREIMHRLADLAVPALADCCFFDAVTPTGQIRRIAWKHADPQQQGFFDHVWRFAPPDGFENHPVARVLRRREAELVPHVDDLWMQQAALNPEHLAFMRSLGFHSLMTVPLIAADQIFGTLTFCYTPLSGRHHGPADQVLAQELARRAAQAVEHARLHAEARGARAQAEAAEQRARFLAEASALLATSLDYTTTLQSLAQLVVPRLADLCVVFFADTNSTIRRLAVAHIDPAQEARLRSLQTHAPIDLHGPHPAAQVIRTGQSTFNPEIAQATIDAEVQNDDEQRLAHTLIPASHIIVPMIARQQVLGAISFGMRESQRTYSLADLAMAEDLAHRAALATDNARLYQFAQDALQVRDSFLSIAAHELKTPLAALLGNTQLLKRRIQSGATINERHLRPVQVIADQASRLHKLILTLLDLSRIQTGQLVIEQVPVDLSTLVRRVVNEVQPTHEQHTIICTAPDQPLIVHGDALRLEQVVQNLIANAIKYSPDGGPVTVEVARQHTTVCVAVTDRGIGIPESELPQLFELFYRASNTADRFVSGMGIGLAVIKEIVTLHGGMVHVHSVEGSGSTFTVNLPLQEPQSARPSRRRRKPPMV
jgi:PAS domain S-box-containing protein